MPVNTVVLCISITRYCQSNTSKIPALLILQHAPTSEIGNLQVTYGNSLTSINCSETNNLKHTTDVSISGTGIFLLVADVYISTLAITESPLQ